MRKCREFCSTDFIEECTVLQQAAQESRVQFNEVDAPNDCRQSLWALFVERNNGPTNNLPSLRVARISISRQK